MKKCTFVFFACLFIGRGTLLAQLSLSSSFPQPTAPSFALLQEEGTYPSLLHQKGKKRLEIHKNLKLGLVIASSVSALGVSYYYVQNAWWSDNKESFHFDEGRDLEYAGNLDKFAHFYGGVVYSDLFATGLRWAEVPRKKAALYGGLLGFSTHLFIEMKDAYSPFFGFSPWDLAAGTLGGAYTVAKEYSKGVAATDMKWSYFVRDRSYLDNIGGVETAGNGRSWHDDYVNQTFWFSFYPARLKSDDRPFHWSQCVGVSAGFSVDEVTSGKGPNSGSGNLQYFVSLDLDWKRIIRSERKFWKTLAHVLNYTKVPMPTLRIGPDPKVYGIYY